MIRLSSLIPSAIALLLPAAAIAQDAPRPPQVVEGPSIVVTGNPEIEREIADFVGALTVVPNQGQLGRFEKWDVCPGVGGLPLAERDAVVERMRTVAAAAGMRVGKPDCKKNVLLLVTRDKRALIEELDRVHPEYFGEMGRRAIRRLAETPGPAVAWHIAGPQVSADGVEVPFHEPGINRTGRPLSRITSAARPQFAAAVVVVERGALEALTTIQLADYAAMRAYMRSDPARLAGSPIPTILTVLEAPMGSEVPRTLTQWDLTVLRGFYAGRPTLSAAAQRADIKTRLRREAESAERRAE